MAERAGKGICSFEKLFESFVVNVEVVDVVANEDPEVDRLVGKV